MARPKKNGKRAEGIQGKRGYLYIVLSHAVIKDGVKKIEKKWISTGLTDTPENVKKASVSRKKLLNKGSAAAPDRNALLSEYTDWVLDKKKREVTDTTYSGYYYRAKRIKDYFGSIKVRELNESMIEAFLDSLFEKEHVQPRTVKDTKAFLGNILEQALRDGIIHYNPAREVVINKTLSAKYARVRNTDEEFLSYEEAQLFLSRVREHELYELFYLTLFFGLRREEVLGLRWSALDMKNKTMSINHTVTKGMTVNRTNTTKTASSARDYPLTDAQIEMFRQMKKKESAYRKLFGSSYRDSPYIFKHIDGSLYHPDYPSKAFGKLIKKIPELPQSVTFHGLRSSCVSILVHQGMDVKTIQKWVGHADIDTTLRIYAKVKDKEAKKEVSDAMNSIITLKNYSSDQ